MYYHNDVKLLKYIGSVKFDEQKQTYVKHGEGVLEFINGDIYEGGF